MASGCKVARQLFLVIRKQALDARHDDSIFLTPTFRELQATSPNFGSGLILSASLRSRRESPAAATSSHRHEISSVKTLLATHHHSIANRDSHQPVCCNTQTSSHHLFYKPTARRYVIQPQAIGLKHFALKDRTVNDAN